MRINTFMSVLLLLSFLLFPLLSFSQGYLQTDYFMSSSLKDEEGNKYGTGKLWKTSGMYTLPLSVKQIDARPPRIWSATLNAAYGVLGHKEMTEDFHPDEILNLSLNLTHSRPISQRWYMVATLGGGIYSEPRAITTNSILANGGMLFVYQVRDNFDVGVGGGLTNSFGIPLILPLIYINWRLTGKYEFKANIASGLEVSASAKFGNHFKLKLTGIEMDGLAAVMDIDGKSQIYASTIMKSYLSSEFSIGKMSTIYLGVGGSWVRSVEVSSRSLKGFINSFKNDADRSFAPTLYMVTGFRYKL